MCDAHMPPSPTVPSVASPSRELSFADWHAIFAAGNVVPINRGWDYRRARERKAWMQAWTQPMPIGAA